MTRTCATLLALALAAAVLLASGCGGDEVRERPEMPASATTPDPAAGAFPAEPQVVDDFADPGSGWPPDGYREGVYVVSDSGTGAVLAPQRVSRRPAARSPRSCWSRPGAGRGLLCRAASDGSAGYALLLGADGRVQISRIEDSKASVLKDFRLTPNERSEGGKASLLRLGCGTGEPGEPVTLIFSVNATPYGTIVDEQSVDPGREARVGLVARDGAARFDDFALSLAEWGGRGGGGGGGGGGLGGVGAPAGARRKKRLRWVSRRGGGTARMCERRGAASAHPLDARVRPAPPSQRTEPLSPRPRNGRPSMTASAASAAAP